MKALLCLRRYRQELDPLVLPKYLVYQQCLNQHLYMSMQSHKATYSPICCIGMPRYQGSNLLDRTFAAEKAYFLCLTPDFLLANWAILGSVLAMAGVIYKV